jgi:hypothetical protein
VEGSRLLIVQPWFSALGHPAQSVLNTARALGSDAEVGYLISSPHGTVLAALSADLQALGPTARFRVPGDSLRIGTLLGSLAAIRALRRHQRVEQVLFLDADLVVLAACWPVLCRLLPRAVGLSLIYLTGPERIGERPWIRALVERFLSAPGRRLYLRTEELANAWRTAFPDLPPDNCDTLPTLEIPDERDVAPVRAPGTPLRFGVIGQVRPGKGLEWLVPLFTACPEIGALGIAGTFTNPVHRASLRIVETYDGFMDRFLTEKEMLAAAAGHDYLLALYEGWDPRMEVATVFLAARVGRPVIVYDEGWAGRVVRAYGCGVAVRTRARPGADFFGGLPGPGSSAYDALVSGAARFRQAHGGAPSRARFLAKLLR